MRTHLLLVVALAGSVHVASADDRVFGFELGPAYRHAIGAGYTGGTFAATVEHESYGFRGDVQYAVSSADAMFNNSTTGQMKSISAGASVLAPLELESMVRLVLAARLALDYDEWPSNDGDYIDGALMPTIGADATLAFDVTPLGDGMLWIGPSAGAELRVGGIGNHIQGQAAAFGLRALLGVRL